MDVQDMPKIVPMEEREWFVLFAIAVAGKTAKQTQAKLNEYLNQITMTPFETVRWDVESNMLDHWLRFYKFGQYKRILTAWTEASKLDVKTDLTVVKLEAIPGIGPKTARFICLYTDPTFNGVPLDTHVLKFLATIYPGVTTHGKEHSRQKHL